MRKAIKYSNIGKDVSHELIIWSINQRSNLPSSENCITWYCKYHGKELWGQKIVYVILDWCCLYHCVPTSGN